MNAIGYQAILAAHIATANRVDFKGKRRATACIVVNFRFNLIRIDIFNRQLRNRNNRSVLDSFHKELGALDKPLQGCFGRLRRYSEIAEIFGIDNLRDKTFKVVNIRIVRIKVFQIHGINILCLNKTDQ